jgi:hypothetical protein
MVVGGLGGKTARSTVAFWLFGAATCELWWFAVADSRNPYGRWWFGQADHQKDTVLRPDHQIDTALTNKAVRSGRLPNDGPDQQQLVGAAFWWFVSANRQRLAVWCSKPSFPRKSMVVWPSKPRKSVTVTGIQLYQESQRE